MAGAERGLERRLGPGGRGEERAGGRDRQPPLQRARAPHHGPAAPAHHAAPARHRGPDIQVTSSTMI